MTCIGNLDAGEVAEVAAFDEDADTFGSFDEDVIFDLGAVLDHAEDVIEGSFGATGDLEPESGDGVGVALDHFAQLLDRDWSEGDFGL